MQEESGPVVRTNVPELVGFRASGESAKGEFHCAGCGYGVIVHSELPICPMCGGDVWEHASWSPLTRVRRMVLQ